MGNLSMSPCRVTVQGTIQTTGRAYNRLVFFIIIIVFYAVCEAVDANIIESGIVV